jgi:hypothetical protein
MLLLRDELFLEHEEIPEFAVQWAMKEEQRTCNSAHAHGDITTPFQSSWISS